MRNNFTTALPDADWKDEERIEKLKVFLEQRMSSAQIANEFGDCTRSAVVGAVHRLKEAGILKRGFDGAAHGRGVPRPTMRKDPSKTVKQKKKEAGEANGSLQRIKKKKKQKEKAQTFDALTGTLIEVEVSTWTSPEALVEYNESRLPEAKSLAECDGCKFPLNDAAPFLMCNATKNDSDPYCPTHMRWTTTPPRPRRDQRPRPHY